MNDAPAAKLPLERLAKGVATEIASFLDSKRATEIVVLDVRDLMQITSYFVIATGSSSRALSTLAAGAGKILKDNGFPRLGVDGDRDARWYCLDYAEVVVHLFEPEARQFYDLDTLWGDAARLDVIVKAQQERIDGVKINPDEDLLA